MSDNQDLRITPSMIEQGVVSFGNLSRLADFQTRSYTTDRPMVYGSIGGSITAGSSAQPGYAYAPLLAKRLEAKYPVKFVSAGIGASNSLFGAFRAQKDMLVHKPDLVTIEYAVNDVNNPDTEGAYEALIRKCLACESQPLVVLIFTMRSNGSNVQDVHIPIGAHYDLPMLSYRDAVYPQITAGHFNWEDISPDEVHPNDTGHRMITDMLESYLQTDTSGYEPCGSLPIPDSLVPTSAKYANGRIIDGAQMKVLENNGWQQGEHKGGYTGWQSKIPGSKLVVAFSGQLALLGYKKYFGDFGMAKVTLDGKDLGIFDGHYDKPVIQAWAGGHTVIEPLGDDMENTEHQLSFELLEEKHPNSQGHCFDIGYLLVS